MFPLYASWACPPSTIAASLFPSPTSLALFRPSAPRPFHIVGKSCGAVVPRSLPAVPLLLVRLLPYGITYRDEKDKRRAENICTSKRSEVGNGIKSEEEQASQSSFGASSTEGRNANFLPNSHHGADIAVITRLTKVFLHRRCTSIVRPPVRLVPDRLLR